jgi:hypothetical protein
MKYIINESKVSDSIYNFIDKMFDTDYINYFHPEDDYGDGNDDPNSCVFYFNDYGDEDSVFKWYGKEYWSEYTHEGLEFKKKSPMIQVDEPYYSRLDNLFGELWKPIFLKWFNTNYPEYKSKSID